MNYKIGKMETFSKEGRSSYHDALGLTGAEISLTNLKNGAATPFLHSHKNNEEIFLIISGMGKIYLDGEIIDIEKGDIIKVEPEAERLLKAEDNHDLSFFCIQVEKNSLTAHTFDDGILSKKEVLW